MRFIPATPGFLLAAGLLAGLPTGALADTGATPAPGTIITVAGGGKTSLLKAPTSGTGIPARDADFSWADGVAVDPGGNLFISDFGYDMTHPATLSRVSPDGFLLRIGGAGLEAYQRNASPPPEGIAAAAWGFASLGGIAFDSTGDLILADVYGGRIYRMSPDGTLKHVAGGGPYYTGGATIEFAGDGGPAIEATLCWSFDVTLDSSGAIYLADAAFNRVRKIATVGMITTVAGGGNAPGPGYGDGGPALDAVLGFNNMSRIFARIAVDGMGILYIADMLHNRIRQVSPGGIIRTVAGGGTATAKPWGDGGSALEATILDPQGVALDSAGNLFLSDSRHQRIRKVDSRGIIVTVAGGGSAPGPGYGDGGPALEAKLGADINSLAIDAAGNLYVAAGDRVRKVIGVAAPGLLAGRPFPGSLPLLTGDADRNGTVELSDALLALRFAVGVELPTETQRIVGDVDGDGSVRLSDVIRILRHVAGLLPSFTKG